MRVLLVAVVMAASVGGQAAAFTQGDLTAACTTVWGTDAEAIDLCRRLQNRAADRIDAEDTGRPHDINQHCRARHRADAIAVLTCQRQQAAAKRRLNEAYEARGAFDRQRFEDCYDVHRPDALAIEFCAVDR